MSEVGGIELYQSTNNNAGERTDRDLFRKKEKRIKALLKSVEEDLDPKLRKKRSWSGQKPAIKEADDEPLSWNDEVIDLSRSDAVSSTDSLVLKEKFTKCLSCMDHACSNTSCEIYELVSCRGFYILKNALCVSQQLQWAKTAVEDYSHAEHTNLTNLAKQKLQEEACSLEKKKIAEVSLEEDVWKKSIVENNNFQSFKKLRWSCLGYHYDWTQRQYQKNLKSVMPTDFSRLCSTVAQAVGTTLVPEAAIINFYPLNATMGGHLDDAEHNLERPIVSFSFGRSALFLIGGRTKLEDPQVVLLESGDAVVMSGESRLCYHGVPCILSIDIEQYLTGRREPLEIYEEKWSNHPDYHHVVQYLRENRLNMNSRQVRLGDEDDWIEKTGTGCVKV